MIVFARCNVVVCEWLWVGSGTWLWVRVIRRKAVTNYCRLRGGKGIGRWWNEKIGRIEDAECPRCREEEDTPDHIVFRCRNIRRVKDEKGRREWAKEVVWLAQRSS